MSNDLGTDRSGNQNDFVVNNLTYADQMLDSPTNNFCTINPLWNDAGAITFSEGNTRFLPATNDTNCFGRCTHPVSSGKWYAEMLITENGAGQSSSLAFINSETIGDVGTGYGFQIQFNASNTQIKKIVAGTTTTINTSFAAGSIAMLAFDLDNGKVWVGYNGTWYNNNNASTTWDASNHDGASVPAGMYVPAIQAYKDGSSAFNTSTVNFGQDSSFAGAKTAQGNQDGNSIGDFYYAPPTGFLALCTKNLPEPTTDPKNHFNTITYAGNAANRTLTGVGFQPDFTWIKSRGNETNGSDHFLFDVVRGVNAFKGLFSNGPSIEGETEAGSVQENFGDISAFTSDGYSVVRSTADSSHQYEGVNNNSETYVAWNWKAGNANTAFSESGNNPAGTHRANVGAGFSIVSYVGTGAAGTVAHGLGAAPEWIIIKNRDVNDPWAVYYGDNTDYLVLNTNAATADAATYFNDTSPTATVFTVNTAHNVNADGENYIAYCFRSIEGFSQFGSYTGTGDANGPFVYLGFAPAFLMVKSISLGQAWTMVDNVREPVNPRGELCIFADELTEEFDPANINFDFTSTGFKVRNTDNKINNSGATYTYMAFAETPFKHASAK